jgi:hypothetical protein
MESKPLRESERALNEPEGKCPSEGTAEGGACLNRERKRPSETHPLGTAEGGTRQETEGK